MGSFFTSFNLNLWDSFSIASVIDIIIVAFVVYKLIMLIKGTRAVQLLKGLAVLLVATALSSLFHLYTLHWLLTNALTALLVALPIVFQPELRRALEKIGRGKFFSHSFGNSAEGEMEHCVQEVVKAVFAMSKDKTGALIVFERNTRLEEYMDSGVPIDGAVSQELLVNIFVPNTPLHDGAVIIRGDRIVAAACVLPLTEVKQLNKELGTRHRAGLGVTEVSDGVVVIVSEETGLVSLAVEGVLVRGLDQETLTARLSGACLLYTSIL